MKAMVVRVPGGIDVLKIEQIPDPTPGPKDVIIKIDACGVCFHDVVTRNGTLKFGVQMPCILGHEISGTVVEVALSMETFFKNSCAGLNGTNWPVNWPIMIQRAPMPMLRRIGSNSWLPTLSIATSTP